MKVNIDKDKLIKHKFWIVLGVFVPLIGGSLFMLHDSVGAENKKWLSKAKTALTRTKDLTGKPAYFNEKDLKDKNSQVVAAQMEIRKEWQKVYELQTRDNSLFWPKLIEKNYPIHDGKFLRELKYVEGEFAPIPDDPNHLTGILTDVGNAAITIRGKNSSSGKHEDVVIYRMGDDEMKLDAKDYFKLSPNKKVQVTFQNGWYFNDKLTEQQRLEYDQSYLTQIRPLVDIVEPVDDQGNGVVTLYGWQPSDKKELPPRGSKFLRFVHKWDTSADISQEAWLAQEDLWIQKEIYRLVRQANDYVGKMKFAGDARKTGVVGLNQVATYSNPYFELKLKLLDVDTLEATVKNLQSYRQKLDIKFRGRFTDKVDQFGKDEFLIEGEPLEPKGMKDAKGQLKDVLTKTIKLKRGTPRNLIDDVEQVLTWETAAVRRIDDIVIGSGDGIALNHRAFPDGVRPFGPEPKPEPKKEDGAPGMVVPVQPRQAPQGGDVGPNGLVRHRYSEETTDQTRRVPVAIALIVDQDHIDRVLTSFGNSKFRFLLNQVLINRYPTTVRPTIATHDKKGLDIGLKKLPPRFGGPGLPQGGGDDEMESNVELVIYGTMTLYQRFPPRNFLSIAAPPPK